METDGGARTKVNPLVLARAVEAAVRRVPGIAAISRGAFAETGTYGPGETVFGVAVSERRTAVGLEIHVIAEYPLIADLPLLADRVRRSAFQAAESLGVTRIDRIDVAFDDLAGVECGSGGSETKSECETGGVR